MKNARFCSKMQKKQDFFENMLKNIKKNLVVSKNCCTFAPDLKMTSQFSKMTLCECPDKWLSGK